MKEVKKGCNIDLPPVKDLPKGCLEPNSAKEKKPEPVGFDRVAKDLRTKLEKLGRKKGISSISIIGTSDGKFSGGMIGDVGVIIEGLYSMAQKQPHIKTLLELTVKALNGEVIGDSEDASNITSVSKLRDAEKISARLYNVLDNYGILDLTKMSEYTRKQVRNWRNLGEKSFLTLEKLMKERGVEFLSMKDYSTGNLKKV